MTAIRTSVGALLGLLLAVLGSCSNSASNEPGTGSFVFTDAGLDDIDTFEVDVTAIVMHKASGTDISALPRTARIDFARLESLGDLVTHVSLEAGSYTGMTMTIDFSTATVYLKDQTTAATLLDGEGNPLTGSVDVPVNFPIANPPAIFPLRNHLFMIDLDLNQAASVDELNNEVSFVPVFSAEVDPANPKPVAINGILTSIDPATNRFVLEKRSPAGNPIVAIAVQATFTTIYQIDGQVSIGLAGLGAMQGLTPGTSRVFVQGVLSAAAPRLNAVAVESGAGTFGNGQDVVVGWTTARDTGAGTDPSLTIMGRSVVDATNARLFNTQHTVNVLLGQTKVLRRGAGNGLTTDALQVGQLVAAFGTLTGTTLDATAATGVVRMLPTSVYGTATQDPINNTLTLDLLRIGPRPIADFDFDVGGQTECVATAYNVDVTGLSTAGFTTGTKVRAIGWTNPVGIPGDNDLSPVSIVNKDADAQLFFAAWVPPVPASSELTAGASAVSVDVTNATATFVYDGFASATVNPAPIPSIEPRGILGIYFIVEGGSVELHFTFSAFRSSLALKLSGAANVMRVTGIGVWDAPTQVFSADLVTVVLK